MRAGERSCRYSRADHWTLYNWHGVNSHWNWAMELELRRLWERQDCLLFGATCFDSCERGLWLCERSFRYNRAEYESLLCGECHDCNWDWPLGLDVRWQ